MEYFTVLTNLGATKIAAASAANSTIALTQIAVGDGSGTVPVPDISQTALVNEVFRTDLSELTQDEINTNHFIARSVIPEDEGNFWIREIGVFDADGDLIAVGNYPETYKSILAEGAAKSVDLNVVFEVANADVVNLTIDPTIVMASQDFVNKKVAGKADETYVDEKFNSISVITGFKNKLFNGSFDVWQRGTSFLTGSVYFNADRWQGFRAGSETGCTITREVSDLYNAFYHMKFSRDNGNSSITGAMFQQALESIDSKKLAGKTVTLSFYARAGSSFSASLIPNLYSGTAIDSSAISMASWTGNINEKRDETLSLTTSWAKYSITTTLSAGLKQLGIRFETGAFSGTSDGNDYFELANIQLEEGDKATDFEQRPYSLEFSLCQRYYYKMDIAYIAFMHQNQSVHEKECNIKFPTEMRIPPSVTQTISTASIISTVVGKDYCYYKSNATTSTNCHVTSFTADAELY